MRNLKTDQTISRAVFACAFAALCLLAPAQAQPSEVTCQPDYDFCVEVDGQYPSGALFYRSDVRGKFFIDIPQMDHGLLMDLKAKKITGVSRDRITRTENDLRFNDSLPEDAPAYAFAIDGPIIRFEADSRKVRILRVLDRPALIGPIGVDELLADRPEYNVAMESYTPDTTAMRTVNSLEKQLDVEVYFGTWCPHCKKYMPRILRVAKETANENVRYKMIGVPKGFSEEAGPWRGKKIRSIPTVIVKQDGVEITRLNTSETATPDLELAGIIQALP